MKYKTLNKVLAFLLIVIAISMACINVMKADRNADSKNFEVSVRKLNTGLQKEEFEKRIESNSGTEVEVQLHYKNKHNRVVKNVEFNVEMSNIELKYSSDTTMLYDEQNPGGKLLQDGIISPKGIKVESCNLNKTIDIRFRCYITGKTKQLEFGKNIQITGNAFDGISLYSDWAGIHADDIALIEDRAKW